MDDKTTIQELKDKFNKFKLERNWGKFHDAKNLAEAISIEAAELQELFLWQDVSEINKKIENDLDFRERVGEELADVIAFCINFANATNIDISRIVLDKLEKNYKKYPVEKSKGVATKYNKL